jgi:HSP20 family protein
MTMLKKWRNDNPSVLSNLIEDFFNESVPAWTGLSTKPRVNVRESDNNFTLEVAVPGFSKEDFNIDVDGSLLTVSARKESEKEEEDKKGYTRREFNYSEFIRTFTLPDSVNADAISCKYNNGLLNVMIPKKEGSKGSKKSIKVL